MKITRPQIKNLIFLVLIVVLLFTPVGTTFKIWINRVISFSPSVVDEDERKKINDYNWKLMSVNGEKYDFATAENNKVVFINFWATWCPPCIAEMPDLQALYNDYADKVDFLFVTNDKNEVINKFMEKHNYDFPVYKQLTQAPEEFNYSSIPITFLIDKKGEIVISKSGSADWNSEKVRTTIDKLLE